MHENKKEKIKLTGLQLGQVHAQIHLDHAATILAALAEQSEKIGQIEVLLVLNQVGRVDARDGFGAAHSFLEISQFIHKAQLEGLRAGEDPAIRVVGPFVVERLSLLCAASVCLV